MNNWETVELGEIVKLGGGKIHTGPFGSQLHASDYVEQGIPCIMPANMVNNRVDVSSIAMISEADAERLSKYVVSEGDIVYSRRGDVTLKALIREDESGYFCGTGCLLLRPGSKVDSEFLTYYLSTDTMKWWIKQQAVGATMPNLNTGILARIPFRAPSKKEQSSLARVISSLDKKIEVNNKINAELEAMAKLIYDYWFVQFDFPDANGRPYKSSGGKMVYNEELKREIPKGWEVDTINNIVSVKDGTHDSPKPKDSGYPLVTSKHLKPEGLDFVNANLISVEDYESVNKRSKVDTGDILFSMIGSIGEIYRVDEKEVNFAIKNVGLYKSSEKPDYINYIYMFLKSYDMLRYMDNVTSGSIQKFIGLGALRNMPILINDETIRQFVKTTEHLFEKKSLIKLENQKLTQLRDWLLPMLMNGQVTINAN
jgi:type I restriction enzyme S subunit